MGPGSLESSAPALILRPASGIALKEGERVWEICPIRPGAGQLYLDSTNVVKSIKSWAEVRCRYVGHPRRSHALPALFVSGLMKTGKSYTLENVVPAVLAQELSQQRPDHPLKGMAVLRLNCLRLDRQGTTALLYSVLETMVAWVERAEVKVKDGAWQQATRVRGDAAGSRTRTRAGMAILELLQGLETPVLVLMDEVQALLQPTNARGEPDLDGVSYIRDVVLRQILVASPDNVLWAVTGSSMAFVWTALAAMPVNGVAPMLQIRQAREVDTPSVCPPGLMAALLDDLEGVWGVRPEDVAPLLERAGSSPALLSTMLESWVMEGRPADVAAFADTFTNYKLYPEGLKEWQLGLAHWKDDERGLLLDLADPVIGAAWEPHISDPGLWRFLKPHLKQTGEGRYYLADPTQRQLLRAVLGKGTKRRQPWAGLPAPGLTLVQRDWSWLLLHLGQVADYLVGVRPPKDVIAKDIKGVEELQVMLRVLGSPHNKGSRSWYRREGKDGRLRSHLNYLVFFLRLSRNVVTHWRPHEGREVLGSALLALPTLLLPLSLSPVPLLSRVPALAALRQAGWASPAPVPAAAAADRGAVYQRGLVSAARNVQASFAASTYSQQEAAAREFTAWLARFGGGRTVLDCTPDDVLVYIAKHWLPCHSSRQTEASGPSAFKSHPLLLSGALARAGRDGRYDAVTGEGNPWPSAWVEDCRKGYRRQQMLAGYQEVSAVPLLAAQKYEAGVRHVWGSTHSAAGSLAVLVLLRDLLPYTQHRAGNCHGQLPSDACSYEVFGTSTA
eukprot:XP_001691385.1 predicted protein [Chlamydomonas reinhardtii]